MDHAQESSSREDLNRAPRRRRAIRTLRRYADETGDERPSKRAFDHWATSKYMSSSEVKAAFGLWSTALSAAGLRDPRGPRSAFSITELLSALKEAAEEQATPNNVLTRDDYERYRQSYPWRELPSLNVLIHRFGGWGHAVRLVGKRPALDTDRTREQGLEALRYVRRELGHVPSYTEYRDGRRDGDPYPSWFISRWDRWALALEAAGFSRADRRAADVLRAEIRERRNARESGAARSIEAREAVAA
jgi:hypothetical protein